MQKSDKEWKKELTPEQYAVLRKKGTEPPFSGKLLQNEKTGDYHCAACGNVVFKSDTKFESTLPGLIGWPAFCEVASNTSIALQQDDSLGASRTEVMCAKCGSHLGHYFDDPTSPNGKHYCINSVALDFKEKS